MTARRRFTEKDATGIATTGLIAFIAGWVLVLSTFGKSDAEVEQRLELADWLIFGGAITWLIGKLMGFNARPARWVAGEQDRPRIVRMIDENDPRHPDYTGDDGGPDLR